MGIRSGIKKLIESMKSLATPKTRAIKKYGSKGTDEVTVSLNDLRMTLKRENLSLPHEVTVLVPRAEIHKKFQNGQLVEETYTYSSITIAHSPRYPEGGRSLASDGTRAL